MLIVTTDRLSAFDRILARVPYKGQVLNQLSGWWFAQTADIIPNHIESLPDPNAAVVTRAEPFMVEVIVRGYITGVTSTALWYRYSLGERNIYGYQFPEGLQKNALLPEPIITQTTKGGATGHDERLTCAEVVEKGLLDAKTWDQVQSAALAIFKRGQEVANKAGMILVDTKYEFGKKDGKIYLIDEVHTPDSSRYFYKEGYEQRQKAGEQQKQLSKEFVRQWLIENGFQGKTGQKVPEMTDAIVKNISDRYKELYQQVVGQPLGEINYDNILERIETSIVNSII
ncbi:MAG TPA: phosphoribosylaminoimidazolesuccinocarboxamide synthase, partial [Cytophagales bacterium]|nr:phosphoribosylaminoimidazolesuccinocarboxamide synthase [Cytophagales bacterium]